MDSADPSKSESKSRLDQQDSHKDPFPKKSSVEKEVLERLKNAGVENESSATAILGRVMRKWGKYKVHLKHSSQKNKGSRSKMPLTSLRAARYKVSGLYSNICPHISAIAKTVKVRESGNKVLFTTNTEISVNEVHKLLPESKIYVHCTSIPNQQTNPMYLDGCVFEEESSGDANYVGEVEHIEKGFLNEVIQQQKIQNEQLQNQLSQLNVTIQNLSKEVQSLRKDTLAEEAAVPTPEKHSSPQVINNITYKNCNINSPQRESHLSEALEKSTQVSQQQKTKRISKVMTYEQRKGQKKQPVKDQAEKKGNTRKAKATTISSNQQKLAFNTMLTRRQYKEIGMNVQDLEKQAL